MKSLVLAASLLISLGAEAGVIAFTVPTPKTNEGLYLCNAGVSHKRGASSTATPCVEGGDCSDEAISDPARGNDGISYQALQDDGMLRRFAISAPKNGNYATISPMNGGWTNKITELNVSLSSEVYGAKYFLEFCYQGPIAELSGKHKNEDLSKGIYQLHASLFTNSVSYIRTVDLATRMSWSCDLRSAGSATKARSPYELIPNSYEIDATQSVIASLSNAANTAVSFTHTLNSNNSRVPRFCVVRFEFAENSSAVRTSNAKVTEFAADLNFLKSNF